MVVRGDKKTWWLYLCEIGIAWHIPRFLARFILQIPKVTEIARVRGAARYGGAVELQRGGEFGASNELRFGAFTLKSPARLQRFAELGRRDGLTDLLRENRRKQFANGAIILDRRNDTTLFVAGTCRLMEHGMRAN